MVLKTKRVKKIVKIKSWLKVLLIRNHKWISIKVLKFFKINQWLQFFLNSISSIVG